MSADGKLFEGDEIVAVVGGTDVDEGELSVEAGSGELVRECGSVAAATCAADGVIVVSGVGVAVAVIAETDATTAGADGKMLRGIRTGPGDGSVLDRCFAELKVTTRYTVENLPLPRTPSGALMYV